MPTIRSNCTVSNESIAIELSLYCKGTLCHCHLRFVRNNQNVICIAYEKVNSQQSFWYGYMFYILNILAHSWKCVKIKSWYCPSNNVYPENVHCTQWNSWQYGHAKALQSSFTLYHDRHPIGPFLSISSNLI